MTKRWKVSAVTPRWRAAMWTLLAALAASASWAQNGGGQSPAAPERETPATETAPTAGTPGGVDRSTFTPSEEVSPDRDVDFPADI